MAGRNVLEVVKLCHNVLELAKLCHDGWSYSGPMNVDNQRQPHFIRVLILNQSYFTSKLDFFTSLIFKIAMF